MQLKAFLLLVSAVAAYAAPADNVKQPAEEMIAEEGRSFPSYGAPPSSPVGYAAPRASHGTVTSYNRRGSSSGSYAPVSDFPKPAAYGPSYGAPAAYKAQPSIRSPVAYSGPSNYAPYHQGAAPPRGYDGYGPQRNAYSAQSQQHSQDPSYDAAKDPVSQYADYIPVLDYSQKTQSDGKELSIYGYKK